MAAKRSKLQKNSGLITSGVSEKDRQKRVWKMSAALAVAVVIGGAGIFLLSESRAGAGCRSRVYSQGSSGQCVEIIQQYVGLGGLSYAQGKGKFGATTKNHVRSFQHRYGISPATGNVGPLTWRKFCNESPTRYNPRGSWPTAQIGCDLKVTNNGTTWN